jgi:starch phosphorylase
MRIACLSVADIKLPREVSKLYELAYNFWWAWTPMARRLFSTIDTVAWGRYRNPVDLLIGLDPSCWEPLINSETFMNTYATVISEFERYMNGRDRCWASSSGEGGLSEDSPVAYFCMEFGVHECLPIYSGGLGLLAGDQLKAASDLCLPLVGVGMLYRRGYFRQTIDADGHQQHIYPMLDFSRLPVRPAASPTGRPVLVSVDLPGRQVSAKVWVAQVGRVPLLLLDTDIIENDPADRPISGILYVRGRAMRLVQEFVLGIAGVRALRALDISPAVWHLNEGHSGFLQVERMRELMQGDVPSFEEVVRRIARTTVFTTHTPVPAGNEIFDRSQVRPYLDGAGTGPNLDTETLLRLGDAGPGGSDGSFNLTAFVLRTSGSNNGVSALHGRVSNDMWRPILSETGADPIRSVSNGVHTPTWLGPLMLNLFNRTLGPGWNDRLFDTERWDLIEQIPDQELWEAHNAQKDRLAGFVRASLLGQYARHGGSPDSLRELRDWFAPQSLTIGFARRFATYKRLQLLFSDLDRLRRLLADSARPVQIVLAGKAHPADRPGQELVKYLFGLSQSPDLRGKVFFLEDYDIRVARAMLRGADLWLNTPRRPQEASGTSGMKAALNGALNLSVLDGWWPEGFDGSNGWAIGPDRDAHGDEENRDREDALSLYTQLEQEIIPTYYDRDGHGVPVRWVRMMKRSIATIMSRFSAQRMVKQYAEQAYRAKLSPQ